MGRPTVVTFPPSSTPAVTSHLPPAVPHHLPARCCVRAVSPPGVVYVQRVPHHLPPARHPRAGADASDHPDGRVWRTTTSRRSSPSRVHAADGYLVHWRSGIHAADVSLLVHCRPGDRTTGRARCGVRAVTRHEVAGRGRGREGGRIRLRGGFVDSILDSMSRISPPRGCCTSGTLTTGVCAMFLSFGVLVRGERFRQSLVCLSSTRLLFATVVGGVGDKLSASRGATRNDVTNRNNVGDRRCAVDGTSIVSPMFLNVVFRNELVSRLFNFLFPMWEMECFFEKILVIDEMFSAGGGRDCEKYIGYVRALYHVQFVACHEIGSTSRNWFVSRAFVKRNTFLCNLGLGLSPPIVKYVLCATSS